MNTSETSRSEVSPLMEQVLYEVKKIVVGQDRFLERVLVAILAQGHLLVEGVPGLAKTLTVKTLARTIRGTFRRIQFTPDLVPADLVGTRIYNQKTGEFATALGPVFTHLLLADEINRAPAKVQSALLEVMQEYQVTIAGETHRVPQPFLVMATQNPIETEGTYPLPEAQVDRFMMKVLVGYPSEEEEVVIVNRVTGAENEVAAVATTEQLGELQRECRAGYVDPSLIRYAVRLAAATRDPGRFGIPGLAPYLSYGASPRAPDPPDRGRTGPGLPARPRLCPAGGCDRPRSRRLPPPAGPFLPGPGRCAAEVEAAVAAVLVRERKPGPQRHRGADDAVPAVEPLLDGEHVHRAALAPGIAANAPGQFRHHAFRVHPLRQHMAVIAVGGDHRILVGGTRLQAGDHGFLPDVQVTEAGDQAHAVKLAGFFFEAADQQHLAVELQQLLRVRLRFGLRLRFAAALGGCFRWHFSKSSCRICPRSVRRPGETLDGGEYIVAAWYCGQL